MRSVGAAIGQSLPIAVGVLVSPMPIVALVLMLVSKKAAVNGVAFVLGWVIGIFLLGTVLLLAVGAASSGSQETPAWASWLKVVLGAALLLMGVRGWRGRPKDGAEAPTPKWMEAVDEFSPVKAFGLAFALGAINPKNLLLVVAGAAAIAAATTDTSERIVAMAVFTLVASLGVLVVYGIYIGMGERAAEILSGVKAWMIANNAVIMAVLFLVLGTKILGDGASGL